MDKPKIKKPSLTSFHKVIVCKNKNVIEKHATDNKDTVFPHLVLGLKILEIRCQ